jgi:hypothetical protein
LVSLAIYVAKRGGFSSMTDYELYGVLGIGAYAVLWVCVGVIGSRGARFDPMSVFWFGVLGLGALALLVEAPAIWPEITKRLGFTHKRTNHELRRRCERHRAWP